MQIAFVYLNNDKCSVSRGAGYIASAALEAGHGLRFFDTAYHSLDDVIADVAHGDYDICLLSASTLFYAQALKVASGVKERIAMPIVLGGLHATIVQGEVLDECPDIDYICVGEGESFIVEFLKVMEPAWTASVQAVDNLGYRDASGSVVINPIRPCTKLDDLPRFNFELFEPGTIVNGYPRPGFCYVYATRGCPYSCSYCCNSFYLKFYGSEYLRTRAVEATINELLYLKSHYPVELFYFGDEMILHSEEFATELFRRVKADVGVNYGCMARVERITPAIVELFRETGGRYVGLGIECGDEKFRREFLNRKMTNDQIIAAFAALRTIDGMFLTSFNMGGYPVPYDANLTKQTEALNRIVQPDLIQTSVFYPFRGTKLYDHCKEHDLIDPEKVKRVDDETQEYFGSSVLRSKAEGVSP